MVASIHWRIDYEFEVAAERQDNGHRTPLQTSQGKIPSGVLESRGRKVDLVAGDDIASFSFNVRPGGIDCTVRNEGTELLQLRLEAPVSSVRTGRSVSCTLICGASGSECVVIDE